jgi:hypothetical protein
LSCESPSFPRVSCVCQCRVVAWCVVDAVAALWYSSVHVVSSRLSSHLVYTRRSTQLFPLYLTSLVAAQGRRHRCSQSLTRRCFDRRRCFAAHHCRLLAHRRVAASSICAHVWPSAAIYSWELNASCHSRLHTVVITSSDSSTRLPICCLLPVDVSRACCFCASSFELLRVTASDVLVTVLLSRAAVVVVVKRARAVLPRSRMDTYTRQYS